MFDRVLNTSLGLHLIKLNDPGIVLKTKIVSCYGNINNSGVFFGLRDLVKRVVGTF